MKKITVNKIVDPNGSYGYGAIDKDEFVYTDSLVVNVDMVHDAEKSDLIKVFPSFYKRKKLINNRDDMLVNSLSRYWYSLTNTNINELSTLLFPVSGSKASLIAVKIMDKAVFFDFNRFSIFKKVVSLLCKSNKNIVYKIDPELAFLTVWHEDSLMCGIMSYRAGSRELIRDELQVLLSII